MKSAYVQTNVSCQYILTLMRYVDEMRYFSCLNIPRGASQRWTSARSEDIRNIHTTDEQQRQMAS